MILLPSEIPFFLDTLQFLSKWTEIENILGTLITKKIDTLFRLLDVMHTEHHLQITRQ